MRLIPFPMVNRAHARNTSVSTAPRFDSQHIVPDTMGPPGYPMRWGIRIKHGRMIKSNDDEKLSSCPTRVDHG
ncbi:hypothetical protein EMIT0158MI4_40260 [Burkholderia ambifaria]